MSKTGLTFFKYRSKSQGSHLRDMLAVSSKLVNKMVSLRFQNLPISAWGHLAVSNDKELQILHPTNLRKFSGPNLTSKVVLEGYRHK